MNHNKRVKNISDIYPQEQIEERIVDSILVANRYDWEESVVQWMLERMGYEVSKKLAKNFLEKRKSMLKGSEGLEKYIDKRFDLEGKRLEMINKLESKIDNLLSKIDANGKVPENFMDEKWNILMGFDSLCQAYYWKRQLQTGLISPQQLNEYRYEILRSCLERYNRGERYLFEHEKRRFPELVSAVFYYLEKGNDAFEVIKKKSEPIDNSMYADGGIDEKIISEEYSGFPEGFDTYCKERKYPIKKVMEEDAERGLKFERRRPLPCIYSTFMSSIVDKLFKV